jgi:hypothetical protein
MKRRDRRRPSPALVIACLALFVALGGTVMAATKIDGKTIRIKSLPGNRLAVGTLPGNRLVPGSVKAAQIDVGSLGQVPSAAHADSADDARRAQTAAAADHAADATEVNGRSVGCPELTRGFAGACWDLRASGAAVTAREGASLCAARGGEMPETLAFTAFALQPGVQIGIGGEWTKQIANLGAPGQITMVALLPNNSTEAVSSTELRQFRCVTPLLH